VNSKDPFGRLQDYPFLHSRSQLLNSSTSQLPQPPKLPQPSQPLSAVFPIPWNEGGFSTSTLTLVMGARSSGPGAWSMGRPLVDALGLSSQPQPQPQPLPNSCCLVLGTGFWVAGSGFRVTSYGLRVSSSQFLNFLNSLNLLNLPSKWAVSPDAAGQGLRQAPTVNSEQ
jgi:hypothetical protein